MNVLAKIDETLSFLHQQTRKISPAVSSNLNPEIGIILGSGWGGFLKEVDSPLLFPYTDIPNFIPPTVEGHTGQLALGKIGAKPVAILQGRIHYYEGHSMEQVVFPLRVLLKMGIKTVILTNAAGGLDPKMKPGDFMVIRDHINLMGVNPLRGPNLKVFGPRFPDMSEAYCSELRKIAVSVLKSHGVQPFEGVYCGLQGPTYETPSEIKMLQSLGISAVGMSTVPETIVAAHAGVRVCGISCITNLGAGISDQKVSHEDVQSTAKNVEKLFCSFLSDIVRAV